MATSPLSQEATRDADKKDGVYSFAQVDFPPRGIAETPMTTGITSTPDA